MPTKFSFLSLLVGVLLLGGTATLSADQPNGNQSDSAKARALKWITEYRKKQAAL